MSVYTEPRPATRHENVEVRLKGQSFDLSTAEYLSEDSSISRLMQETGVKGKAVADIRAGRQRFAVIDISEAPSIIDGIGRRTYTPFSDETPVSDKSATDYRVRDNQPYMLLRFGMDGLVTGRALRSEQPVSIGRDVERIDPRSERFEFFKD